MLVRRVEPWSPSSCFHLPCKNFNPTMYAEATHEHKQQISSFSFENSCKTEGRASKGCGRVSSVPRYRGWLSTYRGLYFSTAKQWESTLDGPRPKSNLEGRVPLYPAGAISVLGDTSQKQTEGVNRACWSWSGALTVSRYVCVLSRPPPLFQRLGILHIPSSKQSLLMN